MNRNLWSVLVACGVSLLVACNEPVVFDPQDTPNSNNDDNNGANNGENNGANNGGDDAGPDDGAGDAGDDGAEDTQDDPGDGGEEPVLVFEPDLERFQSEVMPVLRNCGDNPACHTPNSIREFKIHTDDPLPEAKLSENIDWVVDWISYEEPEESRLLRYMINDEECCTHAFTSYLEGGPEFETIVAWIEGSTRVIVPDPPDMGEPDGVEDMPDAPVDMPEGNGVPCDGLPDPRTLPGNLSYDNFDGYVNGMLQARCTTANGCHAVRGEGGGLWFVRGQEECDVTWNLLATRWFIDASSSVSSPILTEPLGQQALGDYHGGQQVFRGNSDCDYVMLKSWIEGNFQVYLEFSGCVD